MRHVQLASESPDHLCLPPDSKSWLVCLSEWVSDYLEAQQPVPAEQKVWGPCLV